MTWINIGDDVNDIAYEHWFRGQSLTFDYEGSKTYFRVMRIDKPRRKIWLKEYQPKTADEIAKLWIKARRKNK